MSTRQNATRLFLVFLITVIFNHYTKLFADSKIVKNYNKEKRTGECIILSKEINVEKNYGITTFFINIPHEGEYYVNAFVNGRIADEKLGFCNVRINGKKSSNILQFKKAQWHMAKIVDKSNIPIKLKLKVGKNTISFLTELPFIPEIEFVRLSTDVKKVDIYSENYDHYVKKLKNNDVSSRFFSTRADTISQKTTKSSSSDLYQYKLNKTFPYSSWHQYYFIEGTEVVFETTKDNPLASNPLMHLFCSSNPAQNRSWVDYNSGEGYQCKINVTIPETGYYILYLRSAYAGSSYQGTSDLTVIITTPDPTIPNSIWKYYDQPFITMGIRCDYDIDDELNYFTCHLSGDSRIFIEDQTHYLGKIIAENDDYNGTGSVNWGNASRVKLANIPVRAVHVISDAWNTTCNCDVYMNYENGNRYYHYNELYEDDDIKSAFADENYNCYAWAGGITSNGTDVVTSQWGLNLPDDEPDTLLRALYSFDNYLGNVYKGNILPRYEGAFVYSRTGASNSNADIDLWHRDRETFSQIMWKYTGGFTHLSINSKHYNSGDVTLNDYPHGYSWESKSGYGVRFFHPRNALYSPEAGEGHYGQNEYYYKWTGEVVENGAIINYLNATKLCNSLTESIEKGYTKIEEVIFNDDENKKLENFENNLSTDMLSVFNKYYTKWKNTWETELNFSSNSRAYTKSKEYDNLLKYCKKLGKPILPTILKKMNNPFIINLLQDLTIVEYNDLMEIVHKERMSNLYDEDGTFIYLSDVSLWRKYCIKLLTISDFEGKFIEDTTNIINKKINNDTNLKNVILNDYVLCSNYPNPFNPETTIDFALPRAGKVTIKIYDITGKEVVMLVNNSYKERGWHSVIWNGQNKHGDSVSSGVYYYSLKSHNVSMTKKMVLMH